MRQSVVVTTVPSVVAACVVLPLGAGFVSAMLLNQLLFASGLVTMVRPWPETALTSDTPALPRPRETNFKAIQTERRVGIMT